MENKIISSREELKRICESLRKKGKKIVTCNGSFDLFHRGHLYILEEAKKQGDVLVVGLNSDSSIQQYKSKDRPVISQEVRADMLAALECVDYVIIMDEPEIAVPLVKLVRPNVHVNGANYRENCVEAEAVKEAGARLHLVPMYKDFSTTNLIKKILKVYKNE